MEKLKVLSPARFYCNTRLSVVVAGEASCVSVLHQQHLVSVDRPSLGEDFLSSCSEDAEQGLFGYRWMACFFSVVQKSQESVRTRSLALCKDLLCLLHSTF